MSRLSTKSVRQATSNDSAVLLALENILKSRMEPDYIARLMAAQAAGERSILLAFGSSHAEGYAVLNWQSSYSLFARLAIPEIQDLNVLPDCRRQGTGEALVRACEAFARERGAGQIGLAVGLTSSYGAAQRLYMRMGYLADGYGVTYDRGAVSSGEMRPVDDNLCLMMVKALDAT